MTDDILREILAEQKQTNARLATIEGEAKATNTRLDGVTARLDGLEGHLQGTNTRLDGVSTRLGTMEDEFIGFRAEVREGFARMHADFDALQTSVTGELQGLRKEVGKDLVQLKERVEKLEAAVFQKPGRPTRRTGARR